MERHRDVSRADHRKDVVASLNFPRSCALPCQGLDASITTPQALPFK